MVSTLIHMTVKCKAIGIYMSVTTSLHRSIKFFLPSFPVAEDEYDEKCVSVMLEGEETEMVFIDHPHSEISVSRILQLPLMDVIFWRQNFRFVSSLFTLQNVLS